MQERLRAGQRQVQAAGARHPVPGARLRRRRQRERVLDRRAARERQVQGARGPQGRLRLPERRHVVIDEKLAGARRPAVHGRHQQAQRAADQRRDDRHEQGRRDRQAGRGRRGRSSSRPTTSCSRTGCRAGRTRTGGEFIPARRSAQLRILSHPFANKLEVIEIGAGPLRLSGDPESGAELGAAGMAFERETIDAPTPADPEIVRIAEAIAAWRAACAPPSKKGPSRSCSRATATAASGPSPASTRPRRRSGWSGSTPAGLGHPDRSLGFFDGMGLAILTGNGWELLRSTIPGFTPWPSATSCSSASATSSHLSAPLDASELRVLAGSAFTPAELAAALDELHRRVQRVYLHVDLDALDPSEGRANRFAAEGGLSLGQLEEAIELVFARSRWPRRPSPRTTRRSTRTAAWPPPRGWCSAPLRAAPSPADPPAGASRAPAPSRRAPPARARTAPGAARRACCRRGRRAGSPWPPGPPARRPRWRR